MLNKKISVLLVILITGCTAISSETVINKNEKTITEKLSSPILSPSVSPIVKIIETNFSPSATPTPIPTIIPTPFKTALPVSISTPSPSTIPLLNKSSVSIDKVIKKTVTTISSNNPIESKISYIGNQSPPIKKSFAINSPSDLAVDNSGNVYVSENCRAIKITPSGLESSFFYDSRICIHSLTLDKSSNIFLSSYTSNTIIKISSDLLNVSYNSIKDYKSDYYYNYDVPNNISKLVIDNSDNIFMTDFFNKVVKKITPNKTLSTLAGNLLQSGYNKDFKDPTGTNYEFNEPKGIVLDSFGNIYVADSANNKIIKITSTPTLSIFAGSSAGFQDGIGSSAKFDGPLGLAIDKFDNIYVADSSNHKIRKITPQGFVSTFAGSTMGFEDGLASSAKFNSPKGVALDSLGNVYVADSGNDKIRKIQ